MDEITKKRATKHIIYEIHMLAITYKKFNDQTLDALSKNAMIESFLIHAYNLYRFFYQGEVEYKNGHPKNRKPTDIIAEDYIEKRAYFRQNRTPKRLLKSLVNKRNKQLAHLTYNRIKMRGWNINIFNRLWKTVTAFRDALPENRKKWFKNAITEASRQNMSQTS